ncbi:hypothetical protein BBJ28_00013882 [Nothophytophthora sp. Chile5]|nr:hypothetical protein BBJ28_00013882 [Nothophytophthora sp. Chile5]
MPMSAAGVASDSHPHSLKLEMALTPDRRDASASGEVSADVVEAERDEEVGGEQATEAELIPSTEMPHEAALRGSLNGILEETAEDEDELAALRDICQETLATMDRVAKTLVSGMAHNNDNIDAREAIDGDGGLAPGKLATFSAPKSPQERLLAFMPNAMEKGKSRLGRRPSCERFESLRRRCDIPRWKTIDGNEDPITDLTVMFSGDAIPAGFTKVINRCSGGMAPSVLHAILKALTFIGDFDASLAKPLEDELIGKVMNQYEAEFDRRGPATSEKKGFSHAQTSDALARELVVNLIDDISTGAEIATATDHMLGAFKAEETALQLVVTFSKAVNRKIVGLGDTTSESEHSSSVSSLRALNQTLLAAGTRTREHRVFGQVVRRFVLSTVTSTALVWLPGVFRANLTLISTLWTHYRRHLKVELALVLEHLLLRILRTTAPCAQSHQMDIMHELTAWLQLPHNVVEIFLNFDLDRVQQWKIFEHLCSTLCSMGEGNISHSVNPEEGEDVHLPLQSQAISTILAIARSVMDASGHAHLISRDQRTRMLSMDNGGWEQDESGEEPSSKKESISSSSVAEASSNDLSSDGSRPPSSPVGTKPPPDLLKPPSSGRKYGITSVRMRNELQKHNQQLLKRAMEISSAKSLKKAIEYLVAMNFVKDTPRNVTSFLRIYHDFFDEMEIGDYLGEGDEDFKAQVRLTYVRAISFKGMTLVESLRHFLTNGGFRLPGEAQKIERMVEAFAQCYWEDSPSSFSSADTAMIIAYSIIMLNTDLHNPQVKKNKMSREQFVKNNRGIDNGKDLPRRFLEEIYNDIAHNPMHIKGSNVIPKASREASVSAADLDNEKFRGGLAKAVAQSEELMKDLSHTYNTFQFVGVDASISPDLIKIIFERVWFSLLALATSILSDNQSDLSMRMQCLDLLRFCIPTCLFLNMPVERQAFCGLLRKVQSSLGDAAAEERQPNEATQDLAKSHDWVRNIEDAAASDDPWQVMGDIHLLVNDMKETIQCRQKSEELDSVIQRIHRGHFFLKDATTFIHEGDLTKKCRSRNQIYRFFLFNDQLLYADRSMTGSWSPHNSLRLKLTRISSLPDSVLAPRFAFQIQNPVKSFVVYADSASAKAEWMRLLDDAIAETSKKSNRNAQHISTQAAMGDTWSGSIVAAASTATTAMKVLMRLGSPLTSPTAAEREPSNFTDENPPATPTAEDRGQAAHASTRVDVEGESPATEIPATSMSPLAVLDDDHAVQTLATDGQDNAGAESLDRVDLDAIQPSSSSSKSEEGGSDAEATAMEDGSDANEVVATASDVEEAAELD